MSDIRQVEREALYSEIDRMITKHKAEIAVCDLTIRRVLDDLKTAQTTNKRLRAEVKRAVDHYDLRSELYTNDADVAAGIASILRAALETKA